MVDCPNIQEEEDDDDDDEEYRKAPFLKYSLIV